MRWPLLFCFTLIMASSGDLIAQRVVSGQPQRFLDELRALAEDLPQKEKEKEAGERLEAFEAWWQSAPLDDSLSRQCIAIVQKMWDRKLRLYPHVLDYLDVLQRFPSDRLAPSDFHTWLRFTADLLSGKRARQFTSYLDASSAFFTGSYLHYSRSISWKLLDPGDVRLVYDSTLWVMTGETDLQGNVMGDSAFIRDTRGVFYFMDGIWEGTGGSIDWTRAGYGPREVFAELPVYRIDLRSTSFIIDSVVFHHAAYLDRPLLGRLEEKMMSQVNEDRVSYPRFTSYFDELSIPDIFPGIDYQGGFSMQGNRILGAASGNGRASLTFRKNGKLFIRLRSPSFAIGPDKISAARASVAIYYEGDSIYHPGLAMRYLHEKRELSLLRSGDGLGQSPYMDTWHNLDMHFEALYWNLDEEQIHFQDIKGLNSEGRAFFESVDYYSRERYDLLQGIDERNPLDLISNYCRRNGVDDFFLDDYVAFVRKPPEQVKAVLIDLASQGFLNYDLDNDRIYVKERLFAYLRARAGHADYDVMQLRSTISALPNASLSLLNFDMKIRGVPAVFLSDSQQVVIYPSEQEILMKQDRSFAFSGKVQAGNFIFHTRESHFDYEAFRINMPTIDRMLFRVRSFEPDERGFYYLEPVRTVLQDLSGEIQIDKPYNKSGKDSNPEYPIFTAGTEAFVYYDDPSIEGGVYDRQRFNYRILPFTIDSLDNLSTEGLQFSGYLNSGGIFPDITEPLKVQPDYSLGFVTHTPVNGYPAYGGKGRYYDLIDLSNQGLRGRGSLEYLSSSAEAHDFIFYLDSARATLDRFSLKEQLGATEFPEASGQALAMQWLPYSDVMHLFTTREPVLMYHGESRLEGSLALGPDGLKGSGLLTFEDAEMRAERYSFLHHEFRSDTADFSLRSYDLSELAFVIRDYRAHVDLKERQGKFNSNGGVARVEFPLNDYITFMDECTWMMDEASIALRNTTVTPPSTQEAGFRELVDADLSGSEFISIHPAQDSLRFFAERGIFDLQENVIQAEGVKLVRVADAAIFPRDGQLRIYRGAEMGTLEDAAVLANVTTRYHLLSQGTIHIHSSRAYEGSASYPYTDESGAVMPVLLSRLGVEDGNSYGEGHISDSAGFYLHPAFAYQGRVRMDATEKPLYFDGAFRIAHDCDTLPRPWVRFESRLDPDSLVIPLRDDLKDMKNNNLTASIMYSGRYDDHYTAFLQERSYYSDDVVLSAGGAILYDRASQEYRIASVDRLKGRTAFGNYLALGKRDCVTTGIGEVSLGFDFGQVRALGYGEVKHLMIPDSVRLRLALSLDFFFSQKGLELISDDLDYSGAGAADITEGYYPGFIVEQLGEKEGQEVLSEIGVYGSLEKVPKALQTTMLFSDLVFAWNKAARAWVSEGPLGLASVAGRQLNRAVNGKVVVERKRSGDVFTIYIEPDPGTWLFLSYSRGLMQVLSSNNALNTLLREEKPEDRTLDVKQGEQTYRYIISTERKVKSFRSDFLGGEGLDE